MEFGYTIIYVPDVPASLKFYEAAFGLQARFLHESHQYGELETGATALAFAHESMRAVNGVQTYDNRPDELAAGIEIALVSPDVAAAFDKAVQGGAMPIKTPEAKPWGQIVAYVRDVNGVLVEICSPAVPATDSEK